jgi:NAD(P)-dependent dehydrogenase (short-subunit alcohol dehydrogenase family)
MPTAHTGNPSGRLRVAIVTGASRGIGAAVARRLAGDGAAVVLAARSSDAISELAEEIKEAGGHALAVPTDLVDETAIDNLVTVVRDEYGIVDVLMNNGGVLPPARRLERYSREEWDAVLAVNLTAAWSLSTKVQPLMKIEGGVIINVASTAAYYPSVGLGLYAVSKAALAMLTRAAAIEWARHNIRVVGIAPGKVDTVMVRPIVEYLEDHEMPMNPLGRIAAPSEVSDLVAYLVSDRAAFVTGTTIAIDGGELATVPTG